MKYITIFCLCFSPLLGWSQWTILRQESGVANFNGSHVDVLNDLLLWQYVNELGGECSYALSSDQGKSFSLTVQKRTQKQINFLPYFSFLNKDKGALAEDSFTINGGRTWLVASPISSGFKVHRNRTLPILYQMGWNGIFSSVDTGRTWSNLTNRDISPNDDLDMLDNRFGYAASGRFKTGNGGRSWIPINVNILANVCYYLTKDLGWYVGNGKVFKTRDGGFTFEEIDVPGYSFAWFSAVHFTTEKQGYIGLGTGEILKTNDGGYTWRPMQTGVSRGINRFAFQDSTLGYAAAGPFLLKLNINITIPNFTSLTIPGLRLCTGSNYSVGITQTKKFSASNIYTVELSDGASSFGQSGSARHCSFR